MKSEIDLFNMYQEEKAAMIGSKETRTGLEHFPTYKEWRDQYVVEYNETHETVTTKEADERMDKIVEDEFEFLDQQDNSASKGKSNRSSVKKSGKKVKQATAMLKRSVKTGTKERTVVKTKRDNSKLAKAQNIFSADFGKKTRAEIIGKFIDDVGLTANGAATYYQKMKKATK